MDIMNETNSTWTSTEVSTLTPITLYDYSDYENITFADIVCEYGSHGSRFLPVFYSLVFVVGLLGNLLVLWVILVGAHLKSMTDVCLLNLAIADLLLVFSLPFLAHYARDSWVFGEGMCVMVLGVYYIGFYGGIFFIVLMSIDRYLAIVHAVFAMRIRTKAYGILASLVVWIIAISASFPELLNLKTNVVHNTTLCMAYQTGQSHNKDKMMGFFKINILGLLIPLAITIFCYSMVVRKLLTIRSNKRQAIRLVIVVIVVFFCCWTPYNIAIFLNGLELSRVVHATCEFSQSVRLAVQATEALAYSHSCLNPFLYVFVGQKFKRHLIRLLRNTPYSRLQVMKSYMTQTTMSMHSQTTSVDERSIAL